MAMNAINVLGEEDIHDVILAVKTLAGKWKDLGIALGVHPGVLDAIRFDYPHSSSDCQREMLLKWLRQNYNVERFGKPTWRRLVTAVRDDVGGSNFALAQAIEHDHPEPCDCIDRKQHQCYSSDQIATVRGREPALLTYTGPLATANYHNIAQQFEKSSSKVEDLQKLTKEVTSSDVWSDDVKVVALCWESLIDIPEKHEHNKELLKTAWDKASKIDCENGVLLQGRVLVHLAILHCELKNYEEATRYIGLAKQRLNPAVTAPSIDTVSLLYTEILIDWRRLSNAPVSVAFSELYASTERNYDLILQHAKFMGEYEKHYLLLFFTEKAKVHLRSVLITDELPAEKYWPTKEDLLKAKLCLHQTVVSKEKYEMPGKSNFEANYYLTLSDLHLWKNQYLKAIKYAKLAKQHFIQGPKFSHYIDRVEKRLKLLRKKRQEEEEY